uniref:Pept_C1 domain-containing protein n=1 Tax=Angiostrongylus cantonensis TaxID=6313 RepID=A0A0K0DFL2_ANGCA
MNHMVATRCCLIALIILLLAMIITTIVVYVKMRGSTQSRYERSFEKFIVSYNKSYSSDDERAFRYSVFVKNVAYFEEEELKHPEVDLDVTKFADWTEEEMTRVLCGNKRETQVDDDHRRFDSADINLYGKRMDEVDWVKAGRCGSCWAFAVVGSVESVHAIAKGQLVHLSAQELVDCVTQSYGCSGGYLWSAMSLVTNNGLVKEDVYPYLGTDQNDCAPNKILAAWRSRKLYSAIVGKRSLGGHALIFVGYGTDSSGRKYWLVKNSWGSRWGQNGYFKLARGQNACNAADEVFAPIIN